MASLPSLASWSWLLSSGLASWVLELWGGVSLKFARVCPRVCSGVVLDPGHLEIPRGHTVELQGLRSLPNSTRNPSPSLAYWHRGRVLGVFLRLSSNFGIGIVRWGGAGGAKSLNRHGGL